MAKFRTRFSERPRVQVDFPERGRTKQAFKAECDINTIMKRYRETGLLPSSGRTPRYGDFSGAMDFQEALHTVQLAQEQFDALPAQVRRRFHNDPVEFLAFAEDPRNAEELVKLGLAEPRQTSSEQNSGASTDPTPSPASPPAKKGAKGKAEASAGSDDA